MSIDPRAEARGPRVDWPAHEATLRKMWAAGASANAIAAAIPGATRGAILGMIHRSGLSGRIKVTAPASRATPKPARAAESGRHAGQTDAPPRARKPAEPASQMAAALEKSGCFRLPEGRPALRIDELRPPTLEAHGTCLWPYDEGTDGITLYCGAPTARSFCPAHARLAYQRRAA